MPTVGKKKFPYTPAGKTAAARYRKKLLAQNARVKKKKTRTRTA